MNYWLVKSEPDTYGWHHFTEQGRATWDGVRNYQARNNLQAMREGDQVLFYHSVTNPAVVGLAKVVCEAYPDPTADPQPNGKSTPWCVVELEPTLAFANAVPLARIKSEPMLANIALIKQSRLSVMPIKPDEFDLIVKMGNN
ncbi:EVE domain-containing protein [Fibrivirga algicola]|uniref:EVE domain-containing protein n=1 Tax=Fibrivirga algicola TaxID=2950420 RepID=A0ABX0QFV3_9BACT|nr:EVE domain-containing protein [Fibrivirga algicola]NID11304.1 EVE domain-containing protein [Fibrivirga algicola]